MKLPVSHLANEVFHHIQNISLMKLPVSSLAEPDVPIGKLSRWQGLSVTHCKWSGLARLDAREIDFRFQMS